MAGISDSIKSIKGVRLVEGPPRKRIEFLGAVSTATIAHLLRVLKEAQHEFALYDEQYPSPSDPGAYFSCSSKKSNPGTWGMTLGNHGWSGGIYQIEEHTICHQIEDLISRNLLKSIDLENVCFFSHYQAEGVVKNKEMNRKLLEIHATK